MPNRCRHPPQLLKCITTMHGPRTGKRPELLDPLVSAMANGTRLSAARRTWVSGLSLTGSGCYALDPDGLARLIDFHATTDGLEDSFHPRNP